MSDRSEKIYPGRGAEISRLWRQKQLEHTWLLSLMKNYASFDTVTRNALRTTLAVSGLSFTEETLTELSKAYLELRPFAEVVDALAFAKLKARLAILSNGTERMIHEIISRSRMEHLFELVISVDSVQIYKPDERVYGLSLTKLGIESKDKILFVSSNAWDAAGAKLFGLRTAWLRRNNLVSPLEEFGVRPDYEATDLSELVGQVFR